MKVKIINESGHKLPAYATPGSAGADLRAFLKDPTLLKPGERAVIDTGAHIQLPRNYEAQVRPRSGNASKLGLAVILGTIDSDYTGSIGVILINLGYEPLQISDGDRIAQLVISPVVQAQWEEGDQLDVTERGDGGFGHTDLK